MSKYRIRDFWMPNEIKLKDEIKQFRHAFRSGGLTEDGTRLSIEDALATPNAPLMFKRVITEVIQEAIEPVLIGTRLLSRIDFDGYGLKILAGTALGAISGELDLAEGQEYPEVGMNLGGNTVTANIGKSGIAVKVTDEMLRYSQWDVVNMHLRLAGRALARHKEKKIFNMLNDMGVVVFDNVTPSSSEIGRTSGRDVTGAGNGSMTYDDLFDMYTSMQSRGFVPDVVLVHPLAWGMWTKDPVLREFAREKGGGPLFNMYGGMLYPAVPDAWKDVGRYQGPTWGNPTQKEREGTQNSFPNFPIGFPFGGLTIIPTFHVPFDPVAQTTTIMMLDTSELGAVVVAEDPTAEEWDDPARDIKKIKIRERYGLIVFNEGLGISLARNVSIQPNEIVLPPRAVVEGIQPIQRK